MKNEIKLLLNIKDKNIKVINVTELFVRNITYKVISIKCDKNKYRCPLCNEYTSSVHDKLKPIRLKELDITGNRFILEVYKRRFICHNCNFKFTEEMNFNMSGSNISNKVKAQIRKDLLNASFNIKTISEKNNVSPGTVRNELIDAMKNYPDKLKHLPSVISFDEFKADTNEGKYAFVINDIIHKKTLDILPSRRKDYLIQYFDFVENRKDVKYLIIDMYVPYLEVGKIMFPKATIIIDKFHYIRYIMQALDKIRIRLQKDYGYNSKEYNMLKNKNNVSLLRKYSNDTEWFVYTKRYKNKKMIDVLKYQILEELLNINDELKRGYQLKEEFLDIINHTSYADSERTLSCWIELCEETKIEEFIEASKTIKNWLPYICNSLIDKRYTNGFTEGRNNKIKVIKRIAYGYKNFEFYRLRLMYIFNGKLK